MGFPAQQVRKVLPSLFLHVLLTSACLEQALPPGINVPCSKIEEMVVSAASHILLRGLLVSSGIEVLAGAGLMSQLLATLLMLSQQGALYIVPWKIGLMIVPLKGELLMECPIPTVLLTTG